MSRPRTIKTHLPVHMLPDDVWNAKPKLIYISRDPKDVAVSYYHFYKDCCHSPVDFEGFIEAFLNDRLLFAPFREHRIDFWNLENYENILYLTYENVVRDMDFAIKRVTSFLGKTIGEDEVQGLKQHLKFDSMKCLLFVETLVVEISNQIISSQHLMQQSKIAETIQRNY